MAGQKFRGHGLSNVDLKGRLSVPANFRQAIEARGAGREILMSRHTSLPCIVCYDRFYEEDRDAAMKARETIELTRGDDRSSELRQRTTYSSTAELSWDPSGRVILTEFLKTRANIKTAGLFVGMGDHFEIWDPQTAYDQQEDEALRDLAAFFIEKAAGA